MVPVGENSRTVGAIRKMVMHNHFSQLNHFSIFFSFQIINFFDFFCMLTKRYKVSELECKRSFEKKSFLETEMNDFWQKGLVIQKNSMKF